MFNDSRKVPERLLTEDEQMTAADWIARKFSKDHLRLKINVDFPTGSIPNISTSTDVLTDKILAEYPRVANPRPELAFSLYKTAFDEPELAIFNWLKCSLTGPDAYHTFCTIEYKSMDRPIFEAENQCIRAGAATVQNRRTYNLKVALPQPAPIEHQQHPTPPSPALPTQPSNPTLPAGKSDVRDVLDMDSFVFSMAIVPNQAKVFVNWALFRPNGGLHWHMHLARVYSFEEASAISTLHHDLNNILDWGLGKRKNQIRDQAQKLRAGGWSGPIKGITSPKKRKRMESDPMGARTLSLIV